MLATGSAATAAILSEITDHDVLPWSFWFRKVHDADRNFPPTAPVANDRADGTVTETLVVSDVVSPDVWIHVPLIQV